MSDEISIPEAFRSISWSEAFEEGEKRIKETILDALIKTPARDRARLMAQREVVGRKIKRALEENDSKKLRVAFKAQLKLMATLKQLQ